MRSTEVAEGAGLEVDVAVEADSENDEIADDRAVEIAEERAPLEDSAAVRLGLDEADMIGGHRSKAVVSIGVLDGRFSFCGSKQRVI